MPSLKDDYELILTEHKQICPSGTYMSNGYVEMMTAKVDLIIKAIKDNWNTVFIYSDIDVQFFQPTKDLINKLIKRKDMIIQRDTADGCICAGFFVARGNKKNLKLWLHIKERLQGQKELNDQDILNQLLLKNSSKICTLKQRVFNKVRKIFSKKKKILINCNLLSNSFKIRWAYLPIIFFNPGTNLGKVWNPGVELKIPPNIVVHHANWAISVENKIAQLKYVREVVDKNKRYSSY